MTFAWYLAAALAAFAGCFAFWASARLDRSPLGLIGSAVILLPSGS